MLSQKVGKEEITSSSLVNSSEQKMKTNATRKGGVCCLYGASFACINEALYKQQT